jgi:hypothetical protein
VVEPLACDLAERVDNEPCGCTFSLLFPHQQGSCDLVHDRAEKAAYAAVAAAGAAIVAGIVMAASGSEKKGKKRSPK